MAVAYESREEASLRGSVCWNPSRTMPLPPRAFVRLLRLPPAPVLPLPTPPPGKPLMLPPCGGGRRGSGTSENIWSPCEGSSSLTVGVGGSEPSGRRIFAICCSMSSSISDARMESIAVWQLHRRPNRSISRSLSSPSSSSSSSSASLRRPDFFFRYSIRSLAAFAALNLAIFCVRTSAGLEEALAPNPSQPRFSSCRSSRRSRSERKPRRHASASLRASTFLV
mmetsp:Transcript_31020/g.81130  ORF Transcript_31020/g.81130 Transcript_31020/m.81130 type:complete len:224 (-) Transcript_31020:440-1111(-)